MKIVIEIPDNEYHQICELRLHNRTFYDDAIRNGTPLSKELGKCDRCGGEIYPNTLCIECNDYLAKSVFAEEIKADIEKYEADCILSDDSKECKECDKIVFGSIYNIIDKHIGKEQE